MLEHVGTMMAELLVVGVLVLIVATSFAYPDDTDY
jgi:hypothetical protein